MPFSTLIKLIPLIVMLNGLTSCAFFQAMVPQQPPSLTDYGYPELTDVPSSAFTRIEDGVLAVSDTTIMTLGRNTASCLNKVEQYALQVSTYNEHYGKAPNE